MCSRINEKYLGLLKSLDTEIQDHLKTMQNTEAKNTRMYPLVNTCTALKKIRQKGNKNKAKRRRSELEEKKCGRYLIYFVWEAISHDNKSVFKNVVPDLM